MMTSKKERLEAAALEAQLAKFTREEDVIAYLQKTKTPVLKIGHEHWLDRNVLLKEMKGLEDKLLIHGYEDRAKRLKYLHSTLAHKWVNKQAAFHSVMKFLMEMSEHPTGVLELPLEDALYSMSPEPIEIPEFDENSAEIQAEKRREAKLKEIIVKELLERSSTDIDLRYSSDSEGNSDWQLSDEEHEESLTFSTGKGTPISDANNRAAVQIAIQREKERALKKSIEEFWRKECSKSSTYLDLGLRRSEASILSHQPVISSAVALQSKFGELWEWKKCGGSSKQKRLILMENDIVREILWQFTTPSSAKSQIFKMNWDLNSEIMVSSLSQSSLFSLLKIYSEIFVKVERLYQFIDLMEKNKSIDMKQISQNMPSKMYRVYASGLKHVLLHLHGRISAIEQNLKAISPDQNYTGQSQPCTTLIQLTYQLRDSFEVIRSLEAFHSQIIGAESSTPHWFSSIRLISSLQMRLKQELSPRLYQIWLYLFAQCLRVFLEGIFSTIGSLQWRDSECLFIRNFDIELSDSNFWKHSIMGQPMISKLRELNIVPLSCLRHLLPKLLTMLKVLEMVNLLNEEKCVQVTLGKLPTSEFIIQRFMELIISNGEDPRPSTEAEINAPKMIDESYLGFMGSDDLSMIDCFDFMLANDISDSRACQKDSGPHWTNLEIFLNIIKPVPTVSIDKVLDDVLETVFDPYFQNTRISLYNILESYQVNESITLFREIILGEREDFAQAVDILSRKVCLAPELSYENDKYRNPFYQKLLNECYPDGRENFEIDFILHPKSNLNYRLVVRPHFPLNLLLTPKSIDSYMAISRQLHHVRKSIWSLNNLNIRRIKKTVGVEPKRILFFRFALLHLFSSFRSFILLKVFSNGFNWAKPITPSSDLDAVIEAHENYLVGIETEVLNDRFLNDVVLKKMGIMSVALCENWHQKSGIQLSMMIKLEDTLHKCWTFLYDFSNTKLSSSICNELAAFVGPMPSYLTKRAFK